MTVKKIKAYITILLITSLFSLVQGQCDDMLGGSLSSNDSARCIGERTILNLRDYLGGITWEFSEDAGVVWNVLIGETSDSLVVMPRIDTYYRANISRSGCPDLYSTIVPIDVLTNGFTTATGYSNEACGLNFSLFAQDRTDGIWTKKFGTGGAIITPTTSSFNPNISVTDYGWHIFAWTVAEGGCMAVNVTNFEQNIAQATDSIRYCGGFGDSFQLEATLSENSTTGYWQRIGTSYTISDVDEAKTTVTPTSPGSYQIRWIENYGACTDDTLVTFSSQIQPLPQPHDFNPVCNNTGTLNSTATFTTQHYWTQIEGPGEMSFIDSTQWNTSVLVSNYGDYKVQLYTANTYCIDSNTITATFSEQPISNAGITPDVCGDTAIISAIPSVGNGHWQHYTGPTTIQFFDETSPLTQAYNNHIPGDYSLIWTENNALCIDSDTITVTFFEQPLAYAGLADSVCGLGATLNASPSVGLGIWQTVLGTGTTNITNPGLSNSPLSVTNFGDYTFRWKEVNEICSDSSEVTISFFQQPIANAGLDDDICGISYSLRAMQNLNNSIGSWKQFTGIGNSTFESEINDTATVTVSQNGIYGFIWNESNALCVDSDTVQVNFKYQPLANAGVSNDTCGLNYNLRAIRDSIGSRGKWDLFSGPGNVAISSNITANTLATATTAGIYRFVWTETIAQCSDSAIVEIVYKLMPIADAGLGGDTCGLRFSLNAIPNVPGSTGLWFIDSDSFSGRFSDSLSASTLVNVNTAQNYRFAWIENFESCTDTDFVSVMFNEIPLANPGIGGDACGNTFALNALDFGVSGKWTSLNSTDIYTPSNVNPAARVEVSDTGLYRFNWSVDNGTCSSDSSIMVHFYEQPITSIIQDGFENCGAFTQLEATISVGNGVWSQLSGQGTAIFTDRYSTSTEVSVTKHDEYTIQWLGKNGTCTDSNSILIDFLEPPVSDAGTNDVVCGNVYSLSANDVQFNGAWSVFSGPGNAIYSPDSTFPHAKVEVSERGEYTFIRRVVNGICEDTSSIVIQFIESPIVNAGADQELDNVFETNLNASELSEGQTGLWTLIDGDGSISESSSSNTSVSNLSIGEALFSWQVTNGNCENSDTLKVTVFDIFIPSVITPNNDSDNDLFIIQGIDDISGVELTVFNRWGIEVYFSSDYKNDWDGTSKSGRELTNDTYFYVVNIDNTRIIKGFVVIKR